MLTEPDVDIREGIGNGINPPPEEVLAKQLKSIEMMTDTVKQSNGESTLVMMLIPNKAEKTLLQYNESGGDVDIIAKNDTPENAIQYMSTGSNLGRIFAIINMCHQFAVDDEIPLRVKNLFRTVTGILVQSFIRRPAALVAADELEDRPTIN